MQSLDVQLSQAQSQVLSLNVQVTSLQTQTASLITQLGSVESQVISVENVASSDSSSIVSQQSEISSLELNPTTAVASTQALITNQPYSLPVASGTTCNYVQVDQYNPTGAGYLEIVGTQDNAVYVYVYVTYGANFATATLGQGAWYAAWGGQTLIAPFSSASGAVYTTIVNCDGTYAASGLISVTAVSS